MYDVTQVFSALASLDDSFRSKGKFELEPGLRAKQTIPNDINESDSVHFYYAYPVLYPEDLEYSEGRWHINRDARKQPPAACTAHSTRDGRW